jgi:drug/metabolite transporter (DMT)-like permease
MIVPAPAPTTRRTVACLMLLAACASWGLSFPVMKGLGQGQTRLHPELGSWFIASWCLGLRFLLAAAILACWYRGTLRRWTPPEAGQALGLGLLTGAGMLLQMDGLAYTEASTSAFITQCYCLFLPLWFALRSGRWPRWPIALACVLVMVGVAVLARLDPRDLRLGRGELETLAASVIFTAQILWVERPAYAGNHSGRVCTMAFAITGAVFVPVALATAPTPGMLVEAYASAPALGCLAALTLVSTLVGMVAMFTWQRHVDAVTAGVIYCTEPIFASLYAFVVPGVLSAWFGIAYANEGFSTSLVVGGGLVLAANVVAQLGQPRPTASG